MAVIKTKTKFTKSKFTKNKYSTKKKNVSRMTKKMNVMKGGSKGKPLGNGSMSRMSRRGSMSRRSRRGSGSNSQYSKLNPLRNTTVYNLRKSNPIKNQQTITQENKSKPTQNTLETHLGYKGRYRNTNTRAKRFTKDFITEYLKSNSNSKTNKINSLKGLFHQKVIKHMKNNPQELTNYLSKLQKERNNKNLYINIAPLPSASESPMSIYPKNPTI